MNLDWICTDANCGNINFAHRTVCYRCTKEKSDDGNLFKKKLGKEIGQSGAKKSRGLFNPEDWQCSNCANVNWARRQTCNVCCTPKFGVVEPGTGCERGVEYCQQKLSRDDEFDNYLKRKCKSAADIQWETTDMVGVTENLPPFVLQTGSSGYDTGSKRSKQDDSHTPVSNNPVMENMVSSTNNEIFYKFTGATPAEDFVLKYTLEERVKVAAMAIVYNNCKMSSEKFEVQFNKPAPDFKTIFGWRQRLLTTGCLIDSHLDISQDIINLISKPQMINSLQKSEPNTHTERKLANPVEIPISPDIIGDRSQDVGTLNWKTSRQSNHRKLGNPGEIPISSDSEDDRSQNVGILNWNTSRQSNDRKFANTDEIPISSNTEDNSSQNVGTLNWHTSRQSNMRKFANPGEIPISSESVDDSSQNVGTLNRRSQNVGTLNWNTSIQSNDRKLANPDELPISSDSEDKSSQNVGTLNRNTSRQSNDRKFANPDELPISSESVDDSSQNVGTLNRRSQNVGTLNWNTSIQSNDRKLANPDELPISSDSEDKSSQNVGTLNRNTSRQSNDRKFANPDELPISSDIEHGISQNVGTLNWNTSRQSNDRKLANSDEKPISSDIEDDISQNVGTLNWNTSRQSNDRKFTNPDEKPSSSDIEHDISQNVGTLNWNTSRQSNDRKFTNPDEKPISSDIEHDISQNVHDISKTHNCASIENVVIGGVKTEINGMECENNVSESRSRNNIRATQKRTQTEYCDNQDFNYFHSVSEDVQVKMDLERNKKSSLSTKKLSQDSDSDLDSDVDDFISAWLHKDKEGCIEKSDRQTSDSHFGQRNMYGLIWEPIH